ncbi:MAG: class I SAM-dependent methyltransferase [Syntrophobacteraceae bacterium]|nr:class I SAM-dependent methyltransferase [Syntrophobacteraceae bacterium]
MGESTQIFDFYAMVAPFYDLMTAQFLKSARTTIVRAAKGQNCRRILDVACGTGELAVMLAKAGMEVTGLDLSPAMLSVAHRKSLPTISYFRGNGENMPFKSAGFDCVTISLALHEMPHKVSLGVAGDILRVLAPGGKLIVFDYAALANRGSALGLTLMGLVEKLAGAEHFQNFVRFTRNGGIQKLLESFPLKTVESRLSFLGALQVVTMIKSNAGESVSR